MTDTSKATPRPEMPKTHVNRSERVRKPVIVGGETAGGTVPRLFEVGDWVRVTQHGKHLGWLGTIRSEINGKFWVNDFGGTLYEPFRADELAHMPRTKSEEEGAAQVRRDEEPVRGRQGAVVSTIRTPCGAEVSNRYTLGYHGCRNRAAWIATVKSSAGPVPTRLCKRHMDSVAKDRIVEGPRRLS